LHIYTSIQKTMSKPNVLVLGGVGFIGRNFVKFLVDHNVAGKIRVVDKVLPSIAFLGPDHQEAFNHPSVEFMQGNLTSAESVAKIFTLPEGKFNLVFNLAAETKYGQTEAVYAEKVLDLSVKVATEAAKRQVDRFIEVSTAQVYEAGKKPSKEGDKLDPWTTLAKFELKAEDELRKIGGLNLIVVRPAIVYGPGDVNGLSPRIICGAVYKQLEEKMKFLWDEKLRINTVHVRDVSKGLWHISQKGQLGAIYNLADKGDTNQGDFNDILSKIFGIETGYHGTIVSNLAKVNLKSVAEDVNDKHLKPWSDLCKAAGILNTPLTPYLDQELLYNNSLSVDGSLVESTGFVYDVPKVDEALVREQIDYFVKQKLFPPLK
jgi:nucleoside-diphosphate-sugar epimerase